MPRKKKRDRLGPTGIYATEHWAELRYQAWKRADGHCERCDRELKPGRWHLHHLTYERAGDELLTDVEAICLPCHRLEHPGKRILSARGIRAEKVKKLKAAKVEARRKKREKRIRRSLPYRRPRPGPVCEKCGGELSRVQHERQCLGLASPRPSFPK